MRFVTRVLPAWLLGSWLLFPAFGLSVVPQVSVDPEQQLQQHFRAGQEQMQAGRFRDAVEEFKLVLQLRPDLVEPRINLGLAYHALGDYSLAASELARVVRQQPESLPANLFLGLCYLK